MRAGGPAARIDTGSEWPDIAAAALHFLESSPSPRSVR
jgi:hypothetical protein